MEYTMEDIIDSIMNGQRKQALKQLVESRYTMEDLFQELTDQEESNEIIRMFNVAVNQSYISFNPTNIGDPNENM